MLEPARQRIGEGGEIDRLRDQVIHAGGGETLAILLQHAGAHGDDRDALAGRFAKHRRIARITLPLWIYTAVTGWAVYWMLFHLS